MKIDDFLKLVPASRRGKSRQSTLVLWCQIYAYIEENGCADTADDDAFLSYVHKYKSLTTSAIAGHLRKMASIGLIEGHKLRLGTGKRNSFPFNVMPLLGDALPTHIVRYTLPGKSPPLHLKRAQKNRDQFADTVRKMRDLPEEIEGLGDVEQLHSWLAEIYEKRNPITAEQNSSLLKLTANASRLLRDHEAEIQKFYVAAAVRSNLEPEFKQPSI